MLQIQQEIKKDSNRNRSFVGVTIDGVLVQFTKRSRGYFLSCQGCLSFSFHFQFFFFVSQMGENERSNTRCNVSKIKDVVNVGTVEVKQKGIRLTLEVDLCIYIPFLL